MPTTRLTLVQDTLKSLGDLRILTATRDGSDVILWDDVNLAGEPGAYAGREVKFISGTALNIGAVRYVTGSADRGIGFGVALSAATAVGDVAWMVNTRGIGYRFADVEDAINQAIRDARQHGPVPTSTDTEDYDRGDAIAIPDGWVSVENLQWQDEQDTTKWRVIPKARRNNGNGWWVDRFARVVYVGNNQGYKLDGRTLKLWGLIEPEELDDDDDETSVNANWLAKTAAANLARGKFLRTPTPETERSYFSLLSESAALRPLIVTRRSPFSESLV